MYSWYFRLMEESKFLFGIVYLGWYEVKVWDNNGDEYCFSCFWVNWDVLWFEFFIIVRDFF